MRLSDAGGLQLQQLQPTMHAVVAREIQPRTKPHGCSFSRLLNPEGLEITAFVTHTWEEHFDNFVGTLEMALKPEEVVWVCSCALDQNADIKQLLDSEDLLRSPFAMALRHAPKLVVTLDEELRVPERSWCAFELEKASQWGIPTFMWSYHMSCCRELEEKVKHLDIRRASATAKVDQERIHKAIQEGIGYDAMNQRLRDFLGDRLRFYEAAVSKQVGQLAALARDIEEAKKQNDVAKLAILEAEKRAQQRLMQLEVEKKAMQEASAVALQMDPAELHEDGHTPSKGSIRWTPPSCKADPAELQVEQQEPHWAREKQQLEATLEEACWQRDQANLSAIRAKAEIVEFAMQLRQIQVSIAPLASRSIQMRTLVTFWPVTVVPVQAQHVITRQNHQATQAVIVSHTVRMKAQ